MAALLLADALSVTRAFGAPQWGIYDENGNTILQSDSVSTVDYARDYQISDYPQEQGAFQSYNKVQVPFIAKLSFIIAASREAFLNSIEQAIASLNLVTVVTPEIRYPSANLVHYDYRRTASQGKTLIIVNVWCQEVRVVANTAQATASNPTGQDTASPNGADSTQSGNVQAAPASGQGDSNGGTNNGGNNYATGSPSPTTVNNDVGFENLTIFDDKGNPIDNGNPLNALTPEQQQIIIDHQAAFPDDPPAANVSPPDPTSGNVTVTYPESPLTPPPI